MTSKKISVYKSQCGKVRAFRHLKHILSNSDEMLLECDLLKIFPEFKDIFFVDKKSNMLVVVLNPKYKIYLKCHQYSWIVETKNKEYVVIDHNTFFVLFKKELSKKEKNRDREMLERFGITRDSESDYRIRHQES